MFHFVHTVGKPFEEHEAGGADVGQNQEPDQREGDDDL
jgi:hypothetical protein